MAAMESVVGSRVAKGKIRVTFRKLLFDGARINFGDLLVTGELAKRREDDSMPIWQIYVMDPFDKVIVNFGKETSEGTRIG